MLVTSKGISSKWYVWLYQHHQTSVAHEHVCLFQSNIKVISIQVLESTSWICIKGDDYLTLMFLIVVNEYVTWYQYYVNVVL